MLLAGPSAAERRRGYGGWFSVRTTRRLRSVRIRADVAFVDFRNFTRLIPNASTSCGSAMLLAQLDLTAKRFPGVRRTIYSFDGSSRTFYEWLQREPPPALESDSRRFYLLRPSAPARPPLRARPGP